MLIEELISQVEETFNDRSDDSVLTRDFISDLIDQQRALHIRNDLDKGFRTVDGTIIQELPCVEIELVPSSICSNVTIPNCMLMRSKLKIPNPIERRNTDGIISVGSPILNLPRLDYIDVNELAYVGNNPMTRQTVFSFLLDDYMWLYRKTSPVEWSYIWVRGLFERPADASKFRQSIDVDSPCYDPSKDDYPLSSWMWEYYIRPSVERVIAQKLGMPQDTVNDSRDNRNDSMASETKK
jgi:hypothetical protein